MKIEKEQFQGIVEKYLSGTKSIDLAREYNVSKVTINRILKKSLGTQVIRLSDEDNCNLIIMYKNGITIKDIAIHFGISRGRVADILFKIGIRQKSKNGMHKGGFSEIEKDNIIDMYLNQHRGKDYIAKLFNRSDACIAYWLKKWNIKNISRSEISKTIRSIYGPTSGFTGHNHTVESKNKISISGKKAWQQDNREVTIGNSRTYNTIIGKVLGKYEVAYIQMCYENGFLPEVCHKRYQTPYGSYKPDFILNNIFIEIKSTFTLRVAKGEYHNNKGFYSNAQWNKICYFKENIHPLEVIVLNNNDVTKLFTKAKDFVITHLYTL